MLSSKPISEWFLGSSAILSRDFWNKNLSNHLGPNFTPSLGGSVQAADKWSVWLGFEHLILVRRWWGCGKGCSVVTPIPEDRRQAGKLKSRIFGIMGIRWTSPLLGVMPAISSTFKIWVKVSTTQGPAVLCGVNGLNVSVQGSAEDSDQPVYEGLHWTLKQCFSSFPTHINTLYTSL